MHNSCTLKSTELTLKPKSHTLISHSWSKKPEKNPMAFQEEYQLKYQQNSPNNLKSC